MKKKCIIFIVSLSVTSLIFSKSEKIKQSNKILHDDAIEHDKIMVTIYPPEGLPIIITKKDLQKLSLNGVAQNSEEIIFKNICFNFATTIMKMDSSLDRAEKQIEEIMHHNNISREQIKTMFKQFGYSYQEALHEMTKNGVVEQLLQYKIRSRIIVDDKEIEKYYMEHPEYIDATYTISIGLILKDEITEEQINNWDSIKNSFEHIDWSESVVLSNSDIAEERSYIRNLHKKEISQIEETLQGYEVIKLIDKTEKRLKTLEESHLNIAMKLRQKLYEEALESYKKNVMSQYQIIYHS